MQWKLFSNENPLEMIFILEYIGKDFIIEMYIGNDFTIKMQSWFGDST